MKHIALVLALAACEKKPATRPSLDTVDRSCAVDADCTLTGHLTCCDTACGTNPGVAVNAKTWQKVSAKFQPECKDVDCAVMCQKLPDCRDEHIAVCKSGVCDVGTRKTEACKLETGRECDIVDECEVVTLGDDCCDTCGRVMSKKAAAKFREQLAQKCAPGASKANCRELDCPRVEPGCVHGSCVPL